MSLQLSAVLGMGFGTLAALLAFAITFDAYSRQKRASAFVWRESLLAAAFAFAIFLLSSIALGYVLRWAVLGKPEIAFFNQESHSP